MEAQEGIEPSRIGFADHCVSTSPLRLLLGYFNILTPKILILRYYNTIRLWLLLQLDLQKKYQA